MLRDTQIEKLLIQLAWLKRMQFGTKSEKLDREIEQLELLIEELQTPSVAPIVRPLSAAREAPSRKSLPEHLPRENAWRRGLAPIGV
ncbi:transposase [Hydrocarboniphaga effusa]|uniref:transposase n=1 Tax=Hydrocarboniphaga effusa TaxID=243629 RepID=UPI0002F23A92|nr:transposase [Hydrocarboniphaga effusa]